MVSQLFFINGVCCMEGIKIPKCYLEEFKNNFKIHELSEEEVIQNITIYYMYREIALSEAQAVKRLQTHIIKNKENQAKYKFMTLEQREELEKKKVLQMQELRLVKEEKRKITKQILNRVSKSINLRSVDAGVLNLLIFMCECDICKNEVEFIELLKSFSKYKNN